MRKSFVGTLRTVLVPLAIAMPLVTAAVAQADALKDRFADLYAAAQKEGSVSFYTSIRQAGAERLSAFWKKNFPDVQLQLTPLGSPAIISKIETESAAGQHPVDVVLMSQMDVALRWTQKSIYLPYKVKDFDRYLPNFAEKTGAFYSSDVYLLSAAYNTKALTDKSQAPQGLQDFLDPKWKGKIVMPDPVSSGNVRTFILTLMSQGLMDWDYLKKLAAQDVLFVKSNPDVARMIASGERVVTPLLSTLNMVKPKEEGQPVASYILKEGTVANADITGIMAGSPHPSAAKLLMEALMSPEGQEVLSEPGIIWPADPTAKLEPGVQPLSALHTITPPPPSPADKSRSEDFIKQFKTVFNRN
jgi:iron(III) transport system substrate-binding protein